MSRTKIFAKIPEPFALVSEGVTGLSTRFHSPSYLFFTGPRSYGRHRPTGRG